MSSTGLENQQTNKNHQLKILMKIHSQKIRLAVCVSTLTAASILRSTADPAAAISGPEKTFTGTVTAVDPKAHTLKAEGTLLFNKKFNLGAACAYAFLDDTNGTEAGLHPGQKITVNYQNADGVLIADRIQQQPMRFTGWVKAIDPDTHTITVNPDGFARSKSFQFADNCQVNLREDKTGTFADIQTGNYVTLIYETPPGLPTVQNLTQTSEKFTGSLTAIDLEDKTLKAKTLFAAKDFNIGKHCIIVINGKDDGKLSDLKPEEKLVITYDEISGVNVVDRIEPAGDTTSSVSSADSM